VQQVLVLESQTSPAVEHWPSPKHLPLHPSVSPQLLPPHIGSQHMPVSGLHRVTPPQGWVPQVPPQPSSPHSLPSHAGVQHLGVPAVQTCPSAHGPLPQLHPSLTPQVPPQPSSAPQLLPAQFRSQATHLFGEHIPHAFFTLLQTEVLQKGQQNPFPLSSIGRQKSPSSHCLIT
jgi:hypothetical protein